MRLPLLGGILRRWAGLATGGRLLCDEVRHRDLFANLQANHIAWSIGRDILLAPPQRAGPEPVRRPLREIDGETHPAQRQIRFTAMT